MDKNLEIKIPPPPCDECICKPICKHKRWVRIIGNCKIILGYYIDLREDFNYQMPVDHFGKNLKEYLLTGEQFYREPYDFRY